MPLLLTIALKHLLARKRQTFVSVFGIVLGVAFFLTIASLMQGSEKDFIRRLVDNAPHITVVDEYRTPREQPLFQIYSEGAVEVRKPKPLTETRGLRGFERILDQVRSIPGALASPVLTGQGLVSFAGRDIGISIDGMVPSEIQQVTTIQKYMIEGSVDNIVANPDGIVIGAELARKLSFSLGDNLTVVSPIGQVKVFKIVGIFRTGRANLDEKQAFVSLKRMQALLNRPNRVNKILVKLPDPYAARSIAAQLERRIGYKAISWQESSEDLLSTLTIRNTIMYTVVSAVLIVAAFGIYNIVSTVVLEKQRDIAILRSMGFYSRDIERIFLFQGVIVGIGGNLMGLPLGMLFMTALMQVRFKPPGSTEIVSMPIEWAWPQFAVAASFALIAAVSAAYLPARKAARLKPVQILRGGF